MLSRRTFLRSGLAATGTLAFGPGFYRSAFAADPAKPGPGPYGALGGFDANGIALPEGFTSRLIAVGGKEVAQTGYAWHIDTDGQATFPTPDGGWILTANSETGAFDGGGASMIRFAPDGRAVEARRILTNTENNCAGGPTPWGTWLSCEEWAGGRVWECDPTGQKAAVARDAMGVFSHEAVCVDPERECLYMTEDQPAGCFYRFTPTDYPDLSSGQLEAAVVADDGAVTWTPVLPVPPVATLAQAAGAKSFNGGEGIWFDSGTAYFTTKGDTRVWAYDARASRLELIYDRALATDGTPLRSVDNVTVSRSGHIFVCEDGDNFEICIISREREVATFARLDGAVHGEPGSNETCGVVFDPSGTRMYFGVQRSFGAGAVYEVTGPFAGRDAGPPPATAPSVQLRGRRTLTGRVLARKGLRQTVVLGEPALLSVRLELPAGRTVARFAPTVAVSGAVPVRLRLRSEQARQRAAKRVKPIRGRVVVEARTADGRTKVVRRPVTVRPAKR